MTSVATFKKVSKDNFIDAILNGDKQFTKEQTGVMYDELTLPKRATTGSAGYDFVAPYEFTLYPGETLKIPTGIRAEITEGWVLMIFPRSGLGFKYKERLNNTVAVIDQDYYFSDNEGHIFIKISNEGDIPMTVEKGKGFAQGVFLPYGITFDDNATDIRNGGFGSTDKK